MSQDYTITAFKVGDYKDQNGNVWCEVAFKELSEPARWAMRPESADKYEVGTVVYGHIEDATSQAGRPYNRFKTDKREDASYPAQKTSGGFVQSTDESIARAVALKAAVEFHGTMEKAFTEQVLETADTFLAWLKNEDKEAITQELDEITLKDIPF